MKIAKLSLAALLIGAVIACTGGGGDITDAGASSSSGGSTTSSSGSTSSSSGAPTDVESPVSDTGYSKDCAVDDDCVPVFFGDTCSFCALSNATIAKSAQTAYQTAYNEARAKCPPPSAAGICGGARTVTKCGASKKCELVECPGAATTDPHTCADAGP